MFDEWRMKRETKKLQKNADKEDRRLDTLEDLTNARMEAANRNRAQQERASDLDWVAQQVKKREMLEQIDKAKGEMWVIRDQLTDIIYSAQKEIAYRQKEPASPGRDAKLHKLETKWKNAYYALALVEQTLDRLAEIPEEHEWQQIIRNLTKGYKTVNAISTGSDWMTRISLWYQKTKFGIKSDVSAINTERYFLTPIDKLIEEENLPKSPADLLITAKSEDMKGLTKEQIQDAAKNGAFLAMQPEEVIAATENAEKLMAEQGQTAPVTISNLGMGETELDHADAEACLEYIKNH
ncbi:MAG: hypothetical protein IKI58_11810 [Oscillospiraceae bacterium]|nr:hypothetical protein [Oscillospiraceae bacterium]